MLVIDEVVVVCMEEFVSIVLGKQVVCCFDCFGFVVNVFLVLYLLLVIWMVEVGFVIVEDVDKVVVVGLLYLMGLLWFFDFVGLDIFKLIVDKLFEEFKELYYGFFLLLLCMVEVGQLGKKLG